MHTKALLFDLGRVVVDFTFERAFVAWAPHSRLPAAELRARFGFDAPYEQQEIGALGPDAYFDHLAARLELHCPREAVVAGWNAVFIGPIAATVAQIDQVRGRVPCHALSNTNALHIGELQRAWPDLLPRFDRLFLSHEIGCRKPHGQAFRHVLEELRLAAGEVLFFDDLAENVDAARGFGLRAVLVRGPGDVRAALAAEGLLA